MLGWADLSWPGRRDRLALALMPTGTCYIGTYCGSGAEPGLYAINGGADSGAKGPLSAQLQHTRREQQRPLYVDSSQPLCARKRHPQLNTQCPLTSIPAIAAL
jgi:hypothetical protein